MGEQDDPVAEEIRAATDDGDVRRDILRAVLIVSGALTAYFIVPVGDHWPLAVVFALVAVGLAVPLTINTIERISVAEHPVATAFEGVAVLASLVIVAFATAYYALGTSTDQIPGIQTKVDAFYFTVTTLSTVGYGDIVATGQGARVLVSVHILFNVSLIAGAFRVVSQAARDRRAGGAGI